MRLFDRLLHQVGVLGMKHGPDAGAFVVRHRVAHDRGELRGAPEELVGVVDLEHAGPGRVGRQLEPLGVGLGLAPGFDQGQLLSLARVDVQRQRRDLRRLSRLVDLPFAVHLDPADISAGQDDPQFDRIVPHALPRRTQDQMQVVGMAHRPRRGSWRGEVERLSHDLDELVRTPDAQALEVHHANPSPRRIERDFEPVGALERVVASDRLGCDIL